MLKISFLLLIIAFTGCGKQENYRTGEIQPVYVTGYIERNSMGDIIREVGQPNVKLGDGSDWRNSKYYLEVFPNPITPNSTFINYALKSPNTTTVKIWLTAANQPASNTYNNTNVAQIGGSPIMQFITSSTRGTIDAYSLPAGFYRLYAQLDSMTLYDNILITK